jgi:hypothetical protein
MEVDEMQGGKDTELAKFIASAFRGEIDEDKQKRHFEGMLELNRDQDSREAKKHMVHELTDEELLGASAAGGGVFGRRCPRCNREFDSQEALEAHFPCV